MKNFTKVLGGLFTMAFLMVAAAGFGQVKVHSTGNTVIGDNAATPTEKLEVLGGNLKVGGSAGSTKQLMVITNENRAGFEFQSNGATANTGDKAVFTQRNDFGDAVMSIRDNDSGSGNLWNEFFVYNYLTRQLNSTQNDFTAKSLNTVSDKKFKKGIKRLNYGLAELMELNTKRYKYNGKAGIYSENEHFGVIAQDLQAVMPELVSEGHYRIMDDSGDNVAEEGTYLRVHDSQLKYVMINAIQQQTELIESLQQRIDELERSSTNLDQNSIDIDLFDDSEVSALAQNLPNPFNESTVINYFVDSSAKDAKISFFNASGKLISSRALEVGHGQIDVNSNSLPAGTYHYTLTVDGKVIDTKSMMRAR